MSNKPTTEYGMILDNIPIMADNGISLKYLRCGICDLNNIKDWAKHAETEEHMLRAKKFEVLKQVTDGHINHKELLVASQRMTVQEVTTMFNLCLLSPIKELDEQKRLNRRKVEKILGER